MAGSTKLHRIVPVLLFFLAVAAALLVIGGEPIGATNFEVRDYAANSLLIADAKHLQLLHGNYSRVGFYHPGPAILYVHAAGELVLHDWLHLVPSPFSGQLAAVCLYNAAWIALIFAMMRRIAGGTVPALLFVGVALMTMACTDYRVFNGIWMPLMYFFPFAALLVALSRLVSGHADMLRALAVSTGFLVNGHASFMPVLGLMLAVGLAGNWLLTRGHRERRVLARAWFAAHRRELLVATGILLLFFVPLIILTIRDFPGPMYQYFTFGSGSKGNTFAAAAKYVAVYWGGGAGLAWGLMLVLLLAKGVRGVDDASLRAARALGVAFVAATVALFYYAKKAIDQLTEIYIGLFYYAVPMLAAALVALCLYGAVRGRRKELAGWLLSAGALAGACFFVTRTPAFDYFYNRPAVVELYDALKALPGKGRVVLDLETGTDGWGEIWGNTLGLQAYALRRGEDLVCINQGWDISNTARAKCRPEELATDRRFFVRLNGALHPELGEPDLDGMNMALYRHGAPRTVLPYVTVKEQPQAVAALLGEGWGPVDGELAWSVGPVATLVLPRGASAVRLDLGSYAPTLQSRQTFEAWVGGKRAGRWVLDSTDYRRQVKLALDPASTTEQRVELRILDPKSPKELGQGEDTRKLGVSLWGIHVTEPNAHVAP